MGLELKEVEGHKDLVRDMQSTAILNTNKNAYEKAIERHKNAQKKNEDLVKAISEINNLKGDIKELKSIVKTLIGTGNG